MLYYEGTKMNYVIKLGRYMRKEGKKNGKKGYILLAWLLNQHVYGAE